MTFTHLALFLAIGAIHSALLYLKRFAKFFEELSE